MLSNVSARRRKILNDGIFELDVIDCDSKSPVPLETSNTAMNEIKNGDITSPFHSQLNAEHTDKIEKQLPDAPKEKMSEVKAKRANTSIDCDDLGRRSDVKPVTRMEVTDEPAPKRIKGSQSTVNTTTKGKSLSAATKLNKIRDIAMKYEKARSDLKALQIKNLQLETQLKDLKEQSCVCGKSSTGSDIPKALVSLSFKDAATLETYKDKIVRKIQSAFKFKTFEKVKHGTLDVDIWEEPEDLDGNISVDSLPVHLDVESPRYRRKDDQAKDVSKSPMALNACFNCGDKHPLRDCPLPRNRERIYNNRSKFQSNTQRMPLTRYHKDEGLHSKYKHLIPGKMSSTLEKALGMRYNELPRHIYMMRKLGYPPGWWEEVKDNIKPGLNIFSDLDNLNTTEQMITESMIHEYPGFNTFPRSHVMIDEHWRYNCPPIQKCQSKKFCIDKIQSEHVAKQKKKDSVKDKTHADGANTTPTDMELDQSPPSQDNTTAVTPPNIFAPPLPKTPYPEDIRPPTPPGTIDEHGGQDLSGKKFINKNHPILTNDKVPIDDSTAKATENLTKSRNSDLTNSSCENSFHTPTKPNTPVSNVGGTPLLENISPIVTLPDYDNFAKNMGPLIHFENLPDAIGKYDRMRGLISKVRKAIKQINENS